MAVAMPIDVELDSDGITQFSGVCIKALVFDGVGWLLTAIRLSARICRGTERVGIPAVFPVSVDVSAEASLVLGWWWRSACLAPQPVLCLGIDKAFRR